MHTLMRRLRDRIGVSTYTVAAEITKQGYQLSQSHYSRVETGESDASPELAAILAKYYAVPLDVLFSASRYAVADQPEKAA